MGGSSKRGNLLTVIDAIHRETDLPARCAPYARDTITLGWEERIKVHGKRRSDGNVDFATSLPRGTVLRAGDAFVLDAEQRIVTVLEKPEPVFVIEPRTAPEWGLFAYQIGNRHQPLMIAERGLVCPDVPGVEQLLQQHRMPFVRATLPFTPATVVAAHRHD